METSTSIKELAAALTNFQSKVPNVGKDGTNPYFKSKYATLENTISTVRNELAKNGLSFSQFPTGENELATILMHQSGEYIKATAKMTPKDASPQAQGSAITYLRRYALSAILGIATEDDDDGNSASTTKREPMKAYTVPRKVIAADDEAQGSRTQTDDGATIDEGQIMTRDEIKDVQKQRIKDLLVTFGQEDLTKAQARAFIKEQTQLDINKDDFATIIKRLEATLDDTDPLATVLKRD